MPFVVGVGVNDVPIVGEPIAYGAGFVALLVVAFSTVVGGYFYTFAHEGGHMLALVGTAQRVVDYELYPRGALKGLTRGEPGPLTNIIVGLAGYLAPPLLGVAGAALIANGNPWAVLIAAIFFSVLALVAAANALAFTIPLLVVLGLGAALLRGSAEIQAFVAVGVVWFLLISGAAKVLSLRGRKGDATGLAKATVVVPAIVWELFWAFAGLVALIVGGQFLLRPGYAIG
ncbi:MAG: integral rane protein [Actinomycetospora sp.]|jgi:hypothetical protein|nr:integral rane protein [Actinomycetospora sp.]